MPKPYSREAREQPTCFSGQIAITAKTGDGSSTLIENLKGLMRDMPYRWVSGGALMRAQAAGHNNMAIEGWAAHCRKHPEEGHDRRLDQMIRILAEHNWVICEGRLPQVFMPRAFKVRYWCAHNERIHRRVKQNEGRLSYAKVEADIVDRDNNDDVRYEILYPGCLWPNSDYDLFVDNTKITPKEAAERIVNEHRKWLARMETKNAVVYSAVAPPEY